MGNPVLDSRRPSADLHEMILRGGLDWSIRMKTSLDLITIKDSSCMQSTENSNCSTTKTNGWPKAINQSNYVYLLDAEKPSPAP